MPKRSVIDPADSGCFTNQSALIAINPNYSVLAEKMGTESSRLNKWNG
jgi:hypothetical protein